MALLKQIKFGSTSTPIAMTQVAINANSNKALSVVATNTGLDVEQDPVYTLALAVDGKTITKTGNDGLATALKLTYHAAVSEGTPKGAYIALEDNTGTSVANAEVMVSDIIGNGVLKSASYDETTGVLTLTFATASGTDTTVDIDLGALLDIDDIVIKSDGSANYLSFDLADPSAETGQAVLGVKLADVTYTASTTTTDADLTVNYTNGKMLDATDAIPAVKAYVDDVVAGASTELAVTAEGDDYVDASVDATTDNKHVIVETNVQSLSANAGTRGTWTITDAGDGSAATKTLSGETVPTFTGTAQSLADSSDIATSTKTYTDAKVAEEAARADAEVERAIKSLDVADTAQAGKYVSQVVETDGKIAVTRTDVSGAVLNNYAKGSDATAIASTDTLNQALSKLENKVDNIQYSVSGTTLEFFGMTVHSAS